VRFRAASVKWTELKIAGDELNGGKAVSPLTMSYTSAKVAARKACRTKNRERRIKTFRRVILVVVAIVGNIITKHCKEVHKHNQVLMFTSKDFNNYTQE
jgi:hypothetical protein